MRRLVTSILFASSLALAACGSSSGETKTPSPAPATNPPAASGACAPTGCSGIVCAAVGEEVLTTCEYSPSYDCYKKATCTMQPDGKCGWTKTAELDACIAAGGPAGGNAADAPK